MNEGHRKEDAFFVRRFVSNSNQRGAWLLEAGAMEVFECASYRRCRARATSLSYERGKDHLSLWLGSTHTQPVRDNTIQGS